MKKLCILLAMVLCAISVNNAYAGFQVQAVGSGSGSIKVVCESGTTVFLGATKVAKVAKGMDGLFIQGVKPGVHVVKTEQPGFAPESWPVEVAKGKIATVTATKSSPSTGNVEAGARLDENLRFTQSKKSLIEYNKELEEFRKFNTFRSNPYDDWSYGRETCPSVSGGQGGPSGSLDNERFVFSKDVIDESGKKHSVTIKRVSRGTCYWEAPGYFSASASGVYHADIRATYTLYFDDKPVGSGEIVNLSYNEGNLVRALNAEIQDGWSKTYEVYPVKIKLSRLKPYDGGPTNGAFARAASLAVEISPLF